MDENNQQHNSPLSQQVPIEQQIPTTEAQNSPFTTEVSGGLGTDIQKKNKSSKKIIIIIIALVGLILIGIGAFVYWKNNGQSGTQNNNSNKSASSTSDKSNSTQGTDKYQKSDLLGMTYYNPSQELKFALDRPGGWIAKRSLTGVLFDTSEIYIAVDQYSEELHKEYGYSIEDIKTVNDIFPKMSQQFLDLVDPEHYTHIKKSVTTTQPNVFTINGYEMARFEGTMDTPDDKVKQVHLIGYATFFQKKPVYFVAVDRTLDQSMYQGKMKDIIDAMAKTFREYE